MDNVPPGVPDLYTYTCGRSALAPTPPDLTVTKCPYGGKEGHPGPTPPMSTPPRTPPHSYPVAVPRGRWGPAQHPARGGQHSYSLPAALYSRPANSCLSPTAASGDRRYPPWRRPRGLASDSARRHLPSPSGGRLSGDSRRTLVGRKKPPGRPEGGGRARSPKASLETRPGLCGPEMHVVGQRG